MKSAKIFLVGMYIHLLFSIALPIGIAYLENRSALAIILFVFYLIMIAAVLISGWVCAAMAIKAYKSGEYALIRSGWKLLKFGAIPFYIINFAYSLLFWSMLLIVMRTLIFILLPIPIIITCTMIIQSGCVGCCCIRYLRRNSERRPSRIHYVLQLISVFDIISTAVVLHKSKPAKAPDGV